MPHNTRLPRPAADRTLFIAFAAVAVVLVLLAAVGREPADASPGEPVEAAQAGAAEQLTAAATTSSPAATAAAAAATTTTALPAPTTTTTVPVTPATPPPLAPRRGGIPVGKGMWIWLPERTEGGDPAAIVARAQAVGLTHLYVRMGSSRQGFYAAPFLDALLPLAHAAGIRVYGWDFPYLDDVQLDIDRAIQAIGYRTPAGHRIDGFVPDIESQAEGTNLTAEAAMAYSAGIRNFVGPSYPLIICVPRPSDHAISIFPYAALLPYYDAVAPMVYWLNRQPDTDVIQAIQWLAQFGKPVLPIGQAYDGGPEGGRPGPPPAEEIQRFLTAAEAAGATGVSFWSWQHASPDIWAAITNAGEVTVPALGQPLAAPDVVAVQSQLGSLGYAVPISGVWDQPTVDAVRLLQTDLGATPNGELDAATRRAVLGPLAPPIGAR